MITTITGKNGFLAHRKLRELKVEFSAKFGAGGIQELDGEEATKDTVSQSVMSQDLFSSNSLVVLRDVASNKVLQEDLTAMIEDVPEEVELVIFDTALDRRTSFFKTLQKQTHFIDCTELDERELVQWAREEFSSMGGELGFVEAQFLAQRVNNDQWLLFNELQKLINVEPPISKDVIEQMVDESFRESIFNLLDDAFSKRGDRAIKSYRVMMENKVEPHYVFSMLVWQLHIMLIVAHADSRSPDEIAKDHKLSPFVVKKSMGVFNKTSRREVKEIVERAVQIDTDSKSKASYNMEAAVETLIARIAT